MFAIPGFNCQFHHRESSMKSKLVILLAILCLAACSNNSQEQGPPAASAVKAGVIVATCTPAQALALIKEKSNLLIIDVRDPAELREGKLKNSVLIPLMDIMRGKYSIPRDRPLLLVCAVGGRSYAAMQILASKGYHELYNVSGGIAAWKQAKLPFVF